MARSASPSPRRGCVPATGCKRHWLTCRSRSKPTRRATSGRPCAATSDQELLIGGHIDSVPNGGWLDGCLNTLAGVEVLRRLAAEGTPPVTVRLVDWADEEGARFGRSLFGSSAASGTMNPEELRGLKDKNGISLVDALAKIGVDFDNVKAAGKQLEERRRLSRTPHRAGSRPRNPRFTAGRRLRNFRRRAPHHQVHRAVRPLRLDANGSAP